MRNELGYDPRPEQMDWHNTPIPRVNNPLPATPELVAIARFMWWNGDPWTILRNRYEFLRHAADNASDEHCLYLWKTIPRADWVKMLKESQPGKISSRSWCYWCWRAGLLGEDLQIPKKWHRPQHAKDMVYQNRKTWEEKRKEIDPTIC